MIEAEGLDAVGVAVALLPVGTQARQVVAAHGLVADEALDALAAVVRALEGKRKIGISS